jgi:hypothetical protein
MAVTADDVSRAFHTLRVRGEEVFAADAAVRTALEHLALDGSGDALESASGVLLEAALSGARTTWTARAECEGALGTIFKEDFETFDALIGVSEGFMRQLTNGDLGQIPNEVAYAVSSLAVRSHATAHEISALLRAALPNGAHARWRTLHELQVVACVLGGGDTETAARYNDHRWVKFAEDRRYADPKPSWDGETPESVVARLAEKYEPGFAKNYGWAEPEVKRRLGPDAKVTWPNLVKLAELSEPHLRHVNVAHHLVHADALGVLHLIGSEGLLNSGARLEGIPELVALTATTLIDTMKVLVETWRRHDRSPHARAVAALMDTVFDDLLVEWARRVGPPAAAPGGEVHADPESAK